MADNKSPYDVVIIGQGASAFGAALYSARYQMKTLVIGDEFGGETATGSIIENYPGYSHIDGFDLMLAMKKQVEDLDVEIITDEVKDIQNDGNCFISTAHEGRYQSTAVILAVGRERRKLGPLQRVGLAGEGRLLLLDLRRTPIPRADGGSGRSRRRGNQGNGAAGQVRFSRCT